MSVADLRTTIMEHPAFKNNSNLGLAGFTIPEFDELSVIELSAETIGQLEELGVQIIGGFGERNRFYLDLKMPKTNLKVTLHRRHDNIIVLSKNCRLRGQLDLQGDNNIFVVGPAYADIGVSATFRYHRAGLFLGSGGSSPTNNYWIEGPDSSIQIGDDFLFSWGIWIRTADSHALVDLDTGKIINKPKSVVIGSHVWLGQDVMVMPGAQIREGSIIGARSVVTKTIPSCCVAVGAPARVVRKRASWSRLVNPSPLELDNLQKKYSVTDEF